MPSSRDSSRHPLGLARLSIPKSQSRVQKSRVPRGEGEVGSVKARHRRARAERQASEGWAGSGRGRRPPSMQVVVARPSSRQPLVVAVKAVSLHNLDHVTKFGLLHRARDWAVHFQGAVAAPAMIVLEVVAEKASQVAFTEDDHVIEALTPDAADDSLHEGALPRAPRGGENLLDAQAFHPRLELVPVDAIAISDEEPRGRLPRERFGELLGGPLRGRMFGHVEVHDPTAGVSAADIFRMRSRISRATAGLPVLGRERRAQWSRNLRRCQAITVLGRTKTSALRQALQVLERPAQRRRSATLMRGRAPRRW